MSASPAPGLAARILASTRVPPDCIEAQRAIVRARIVALAPVLAALTLAWSALDALVLPQGMLGPVLAARAAIAVALLLIARAGRRLPVMALLRLLVWVQALGFGLMQAFFVPPPGTGVSVGYELAPFVIAAEIALFPISWAHTLRLGLAPVAALALGALGTAPSIDAGFWRDAWLVGLLLGTAAWTTQAQLLLLVKLTSARRDASHDPLTGLANRRFAQARIDLEHTRFRRKRTPLSVLMLDLDHFKRVNDRWGHAAGDQVLRAVAGAIRAELREGDVGARFGGEEFVVVLPDTPLDDAMRVAERIRRRIGSLDIETDEALLQVTISAGAAQLEGDEAIDTLLARADHALYRAKAEGRDRCVAAAPVGEGPPPGP